MASQSISSGGSTTTRRNTVRGIPEHCRCGAFIVTRMSRTAANPGRRYYRCAYAATEKNAGYGHCFKWIDEALEDEVSDLKDWTSECVLEVKLSGKDFLEMHKQMKNNISEAVKDAVTDMSLQMKRIVWFLAVSVIVYVVFIVVLV